MIDATTFNELYESGTAPWAIGEPQPAVVELAESGRIFGTVLDPGCGTGDNAIMLARHGFDVVGVDFSASALRSARAKTSEAGVTVRFAQADALAFDGETTYDTVVDSALFHVFDDEQRPRYIDSLAKATRPGSVIHVLALAQTPEPASYPQVSQDTIRSAFGDDRWELETLDPSAYRATLDEAGNTEDFAAWLARVRRV